MDSGITASVLDSPESFFKKRNPLESKTYQSQSSNQAFESMHLTSAGHFGASIQSQIHPS
jgi:hypothetical protein